MTSHLERPARPSDRQDHASDPPRPPDMPAREAFERPLDARPAWMGPAIPLRNALMRPFSRHRPRAWLTRARRFALPIVDARRDAFETGLTDRHLTVTPDVETMPDRATARPQIWFENAHGPVYLRRVRPVHHGLMRHMVAGLGAST